MDMSNNIALVDISAIDSAGRLNAACLVMESLPDYYAVDGIDEIEMAAAVAALIGESQSEIEKGYAAVCGNEVVGILTYLYSESLSAARLVGAQTLFKRLSQESARQFRNHLRNYDAGYGTVPDRSIYLSRFAIHKNYRGSGLASQMMELFLSLKGDPGVRRDTFSLHVDQKNERAIAFYRKHGFGSYHVGSRYITMVLTDATQFDYLNDRRSRDVP
jgi:ribosomal protein S18 acetylase RimI-like enzyme